MKKSNKDLRSYLLTLASIKPSERDAIPPFAALTGYAAKSCQQIYFGIRPQELARLEVPKTALREKSSW